MTVTFGHRQNESTPEAYVTVMALHEGRWLLAQWNGTSWMAAQAEVLVTEWKPCVVSGQAPVARAA